MKNSLFTCFIGVLLTCTITSFSYSQNINSTAKLKSSNEEFISSSKEMNIPNPAISLKRNEVKSRTIRSFLKTYKNISNENWYRKGDFFFAEFTVDDIKYRVVYDNIGNRLQTIRTYHENKLAKNIRHRVKTSYYDYEITFIQEIETPDYSFTQTDSDTFTYIVHLEGKTKFINLKLNNEGMGEWQKFDKAR